MCAMISFLHRKISAAVHKFRGNACTNSSSSHRWSPFLGGGSAGLDPNAIKLIHCIYCKDCHMETQTSSETSGQHHSHAHTGNMLESFATPGSINSSLQTSLAGIPLAQPRTPPDQASIQSSMDKNKETLKRKLMLRRSVNELVDRGIYPPLKTPPAFAEKTKQLERAKTGDLLRHKIQQRPDRRLLVQQHILEDTTIAPSLHERQRLLKRSCLVDGLNDKLAHRPGPLELVQGNILQPSRELANAIKDGTIQFVPTCDTEDMDQSSSSFVFDDESAGSDGAPSPSMDESSGLSDVSSPSSAPPISFAESLPISFTFTKGIPLPLAVNKSPLMPLVCSNPTIISASSSAPKVGTSHSGTSSVTSTLSSNNNNNNNIGKFRSKKPKPKTTSKARIIKFHEYKGPPSVVKSQPSNTPIPASITAVDDTPYHLMLQQQQLFLQWQLEFQQRQHQQGLTLSPGATSPTSGESSLASPVMNSIIVTSPMSLPSSSPTLVQPPIAGNTSLGQIVSLNQPQISSPPMITQAVFSPVSPPTPTIAQTTAQVIVQTANPQMVPAPTAPPPPPLPPTRPTQSVAPRQSTKALTSIPASALSLPKLVGNLEEMKVADLKAELKKRSLPVSGPKPQLIERLKPFTESSSSNMVPSSVIPKSNSRPPSRVSTPLQFSQTTFHIKTEPNGDVTASPVTRPIPSTTAPSLLTSSTHSLGSSSSSTFTMPVTLPPSTQGFRTVVSVKPMVKEEPMTVTDISPPISPPTLMAPTPGTITPMSPDYETSSPPSLISELKPVAIPISQSLFKSANVTHNKLMHTNNQNINSVSPGQTVITMATDTQQSTSLVPAEMMPIEVDSVSVDLNQGVDDTAFKAASLGHSLDSADFKAFIQQPFSNSGYKTINLSHGTLDDKTTGISSNAVDAKGIKTVNLNTNFDGMATIKTINISPNTDPATIKTINLGSIADASPFKTLSLSQSTDASGFKTISISPMGDAVSQLKTVKVPITQLAATHTSPVQLTAPLSHSLLQQLHTLQQLQQQLIQQTQAQQFHQQSSQAATIQLTTNDQMVLAQAKQIEELQRQLQESHLKLKLQELQQHQQPQVQQQQLQLQQQHQVQLQQQQTVQPQQVKMQQQQQVQQQQQQTQMQHQLWQVRIPTNFAQNSLLNKLSQDQQSITPQISQVMTSPLQLQHQQSTLVTQQPTASVVQQQQQQGSVFLNGQTIQRTPIVVTGVQQTQIQTQQHQSPVMMNNQAMVSSGNSIAATCVSASGTVTSDSNLISMATGGSGHTTVSLPYAIHINLTSSGQVKLPSQLQPITTSTAAATITKPSTLSSVQLPAKLFLNQASTNMLASQSIKSEPSTQHSMGPPTTAAVPKSQVTSNQSLMFTASPSPSIMIPGHTNGIISRTTSVPTSLLVTDQQKQNIQRCSSAPYFNGPLKEPPRYDEAIKIKQQQTVIPQVNTNNNNRATSINNLSKSLRLGQIAPDIKSQTMDDVLEILIRNGDLPPSAATEALSAPRSTQVVAVSQTDVGTISSSSLLGASSMSLVSATAQNHPVRFPSPATSLASTISHQHDRPSTISVGPRDQTLTSIHTNMFSESLLNDSTHTSSPLNPDTSGSSSYFLNDGTSACDGGELLYWGEMMPSPDLTTMDWSVESGFGHLDLGDTNLNFDSKIGDDNHSNEDHEGMQGLDLMYTASGSGSNNHSDNNSSINFHTANIRGSQHDLTILGLSGDSDEAVDPSSQMDVSEWLDVIMPNSNISLEPMNAPASIPFSADPVLTSRSRQEVFDFFDFDDPDFGPSTMGWDKLMEQGTSS